MSSCPGIDNLLTNCIGLTKDDCILLVYDYFCADIKHLLEKSCAEIGIVIESHLMDNYNGINLPAEIEKDFLDSQYPNIIVASQNSVWHTPARKKAKYELGKKIVSLIANSRHIYDGACIVDIDRMAVLGKKLYQIFEKGKNVRIQTQSGTNVTAEIETPFLEDGLYRLPGTGGDFPPGEIGFGPLEGSVNGVIVYDIKIQYLGLVSKDPLRLKIKNDRVIDVHGKFRGELEAFFEKTDPILWFISEVSMGLNPETPIDPSPTHIVEEKKLGTAHFGHGGNASYGKRIGFHLDGVVNCPTISVGDETVMKEGKFPYDIIDSESAKWLGKYNLIAV